MQRIHQATMRFIGLSVLGLSGLGLSVFAQEVPKPQQAAPVVREAMQARRAAMQRLTADFSAAVKNGSLPADDQQKAQEALAKLQPHAKGAPRDAQARHEAMKTVRTLSASPALRAEDRELLAKDLAAVKPNRARKN